MEAKDAFAYMDTHKNGKLSISEIVAKLSDMGYSESEIENVVLFLDSGVITKLALWKLGDWFVAM